MSFTNIYKVILKHIRRSKSSMISPCKTFKVIIVKSSKPFFSRKFLFKCIGLSLILLLFKKTVAAAICSQNESKIRKFKLEAENNQYQFASV